MRNLEERMEEIRRRSEICIAKRKRRQRMLLSVVSSGLCVCLCLGAVFLLGKDRAGEDKLTGEAQIGTLAAMDRAPAGNVPEEKPENSLDDLPDTDGASLPEDNGMDVPEYGLGLRALEVTAGELSSCTFAPTVLQQTEKLLAGLVFESRVLGGSGTVTEAETPDCTFTLVLTDGTRAQYRLTGICLENAQTGAFVHLSQTQLTQLHALLGIG